MTTLSEVKRRCRECGAFVSYDEDTKGHKCANFVSVDDWETEGDLIVLLRKQEAAGG